MTTGHLFTIFIIGALLRSKDALQQNILADAENDAITRYSSDTSSFAYDDRSSFHGPAVEGLYKERKYK